MRYFKLTEFACNCGCGTNKINKTFIGILSNARSQSINYDGKPVPFIIVSGFRCVNHPESVKYKKRNPNSNSEHTKGLAVDILVRNSRERAVILGALMSAGFTRFGIGSNNNGFSFLHVDMASADDKPQGVVWTY